MRGAVGDAGNGSVSHSGCCLHRCVYFVEIS